MLDKLALSLLDAQPECTLCWVTGDGMPAATVVSYLYADGCLWMTAESHAPRLRAIARQPQLAVVVSGTGSKLGHTRCVSLRGHCEMLTDKATRDWFFPRFARRVLPKSRIGARMMAASMNNENNVVLRFTPQWVKTWDAHKAMVMANAMP
ncbi:MAG TPA: pyridoxamine 5'-phosphate oxidase family protein [Pseudomonadales bacterium]